MRTILAIFNDGDMIRKGVQALRQVGLDAHYIKVIVREPESENAVAYVGGTRSGEETAGPWETATPVHGAALHQMLRADFGENTAVNLLKQVEEERFCLLIAQVPHYLLEAAIEALRSCHPTRLKQGALAWEQRDHPPKPSPFTAPAVPRTKDFYDPSGSFPHPQEVEPTLAYDVRRSPFYDHYRVHFAPAGIPFARYAPAYQFGYEAAALEQWRGQSWTEAKTAVQSQWENQRASQPDWADIHEAIRHGWHVAANENIEPDRQN